MQQNVRRFLEWLEDTHPVHWPIDEVWHQPKADKIMRGALDRYAGREELDLDFDRLRAVLEKWMGGMQPDLQNPKIRIKIQQKTDHSIRVAATSYRAARKAGWRKRDASRNAVLIALHDLRERGQMPDEVAMGILKEFGFGSKEFAFLNHFTMTNKTTGADDTEDVFNHAKEAIGDHSDLDTDGKLKYILGKMSDRLDNLSKRVQLQWLRKPVETPGKSEKHFQNFEKLAKDGPKYLAVSMDMLEMLGEAWRKAGGNRKTLKYFWDNLDQWVWRPLLKRYPELAAIRDSKSDRARVRAGQLDLLAKYRDHPDVLGQLAIKRQKKDAKLRAASATSPYQQGSPGVDSRTIPAPQQTPDQWPERRPTVEWFRF